MFLLKRLLLGLLSATCVLFIIGASSGTWTGSSGGRRRRILGLVYHRYVNS